MNYDVKKLKEDLIKWIQDTVGDCNVVIGISGGKDSSVVAALCVEDLGQDKVLGVLMPDGEQQDIDKAYQLVDHLGIKHIEVNIGNITKELRKTLMYAPILEGKRVYDVLRPANVEICKFGDVYETNTPARIRMTTLYGIAAIIGNARIAGTCNRSETYTYYFTKWGDGASDFEPLLDLTVREVKELGYELGLPQDLIEKTPSDGMSGKSDEEKMGFTYEELDSFLLDGITPKKESYDKIMKLHTIGAHKGKPIPKFHYLDKNKGFGNE